ncbi:hypothetical protein [Rhizomonospora bruguierae]|uniref:hypothetical protein n=1 Tax=Rhizomonospora bruguierae TaxID=1581705 RepID=UPI0020C021AA|nr:hypothetical protein [Micromonospora sp. NBRC 107566]
MTYQQGDPRGTGAQPRSGGRTTEERAAAGRFESDGATALAPRPGRRVRAQSPAGERAPRLRVAPPAPVVVPRTPFIVLVLLAVVGGVLGILVLNTKINENAFKLQDLQESQAALNDEEQSLNQQIAQYEDPGNLAALARKLGLVPAGVPAYIRLPDGKVVGVPQPAGGSASLAADQPADQTATGGPSGPPVTGQRVGR